jgi:hypothetical protein
MMSIMRYEHLSRADLNLLQTLWVLLEESMSPGQRSAVFSVSQR